MAGRTALPRSFASLRMTNRAAGRASSGQALMIAVLVLFAVATLAALFAALISSQLAQVGRHSDVVQLRNIAEAGLRFANQQLTYGMEGADWRPSQSTYRTGGGEAEIRVSYGPAPGQLQSRFIRIVATAIFPDNPFLRHTVLALKPLLLTDYARFITDRFESHQAASLGVLGVELAGAARSAANGGQYAFGVRGPIRSNTDLIWYGPSWVDLIGSSDSRWSPLGILRDDKIEVAGKLLPGNTADAGAVLNLAVDGLTRMNDLFHPSTDLENMNYVSGCPDVWRSQGIADPRHVRVLAELPADYQPAGAVVPLEPDYLAAPRVRPPQLDAVDPDLQTNRYLALTRDSGEWLLAEDGVLYVNTGRSGWGWTNFGGIYVDNTDDIQYAHDLEKLRLNWMRSVGLHGLYGGEGDKRGAGLDGVLDLNDVPPSGPADWWDKTGRYYAPPGAEIILHGAGTACPWVEIIRYDRKLIKDEAGQVTGEFYWRYPSGNPIPVTAEFKYTGGRCLPQGTGYPLGVSGNLARFPFPANGVIYCEGNVRIRGTMPTVHIVNNERPGTYLLGNWQQGLGRSRRYDLQVVSGGTIYIEGDLLTPRGAGLAVPGDPNNLIDLDAEDRDYGSRLALLARDYVCLNTTALNPRPTELFEEVPVEASPGAYHYHNDRFPIYGTGGYSPDLFFRGPEVAYGQYPDGDEPIPAIPTQPDRISFLYRNVRLQDTRPDGLRSLLADLRLILGHSGWYSDDPDNAEVTPEAPPPPDTNKDVDDPAVDIWLRIGAAAKTFADATPFAWEHDSEAYTFLRPEVADLEGADQSGHWYLPTVSRLEFLPLVRQKMVVRRTAQPVVELLTGDDILYLSPHVHPVRKVEKDEDTGEKTVVGWEVRPDQLAYVLGPVAIAPPRAAGPMPVRIEALIYAQNGSWFIIPGPWFKEEAPTTEEGWETEYSYDYPGYHEPLNFQITVFGAIAENLPAPVGDVADWTSKWLGMAGKAGGLIYEYDPLLRWVRWQQDPSRPTDPRALVQAARFPSLPLTPDLMVWGERISGQAGG